MLIHFSKNPVQQFIGIAYYNRLGIFLFLLVATIPTIMCLVLDWHWLEMDMVPVSILGGALAIFLGFRNNSAYDRWWEARKIWGGIVNYSRTFAMQVMSFPSPAHSNGEVTEEERKAWQRDMIMRHLAWLYALNMHLRKKFDWDKLDDYITVEEVERIKKLANKPTQLINTQGQRLRTAHENGYIDNFRHVEMARVQEEFYNLQGKAERIKNTVFPFYYNYFTRVFLWIFVVCLPFGLVHTMHWGTIPMTAAIGFVFYILEKSGAITENPFEGRAADTPITTIVRAIEIDVMQILGEEKVPESQPMITGRFGVVYQE